MKAPTRSTKYKALKVIRFDEDGYLVLSGPALQAIAGKYLGVCHNVLFVCSTKIHFEQLPFETAIRESDLVKQERYIKKYRREIVENLQASIPDFFSP